jgi:hypothetical protein
VPAPFFEISISGIAIAIVGVITVVIAVGACCADCVWWVRKQRRARAEEEIPLNALDEEDAIPPVVGRSDIRG